MAAALASLAESVGLVPFSAGPICKSPCARPPSSSAPEENRRASPPLEA